MNTRVLGWLAGGAVLAATFLADGNGARAGEGQAATEQPGAKPASSAATTDVLTAAEREQFFQGYFDRMTAPKPLTRFRAKEEWLAHRAGLRGQILRSLGLSPLPERVPLDPKVTGRIERDDYTIERVYYQVLPKVYASGYLYLPAKTARNRRGEFQTRTSASQADRLPAVLNPHGHWVKGAVDPTVTTRCIALAKKGYVAFCPDSTHVADFATGLCPIGLMTWNNMRALDYLASLDCVDPARIGCTGESGGGQQTMYLAALDERVKVAVPAVLVSYFRRILFVSEQAHCFCNHAPGIAGVTDEHEISAMIAPCPTRFITATGDWTKEFPREEFPDIRHIFQLVGGDVDCVQFDKPHNYDQDSREQMYPWMNQYLKGLQDPAAAKEPPITPEDPAALRALSQALPEAPGLEGAVAWYRQQYTFKEPKPEGLADWEAYSVGLRHHLRELLGESVPPVPLNARSRGVVEVEGLKAEKVVFDTEPAVTVPAWLFLPEKRTFRMPALVVTHPDGKHGLLRARAALLRALLDRAVVVLALDPRMRGELRRNWRWNEMIWGRPEAGMAAHDVNCAGAYLRARPDVDPKRIFVLGLGEAGRFALNAGALDPGWAGVAMDAVGPLYAEGTGTNAPANVLRFGDVPQFAALVAARPLWLNGAGSRFGFTSRAYQAYGQAARLRLSDLSAEAFDGAFPDWLSAPGEARR